MNPRANVIKAIFMKDKVLRQKWTSNMSLIPQVIKESI